MNSALECAKRWFASGMRVAVACVTQTSGSAPCSPGALMVVNERSETSGSIGVDCVESAIVLLANRVLDEMHPIETVFDASGDDIGGVALPCGGAIRVLIREVAAGEVDALFEAQAAMMVIIAGSNDYARALEQLCTLAGYVTILVDPRPAFAAPGVVRAWPDDFLAAREITASTAIVLLSHDTRYDTAFLLAALRSRAFFVGAIGSRRTQRLRRERLIGAGASESEIARLRAPIGLDIGAQNAFETAVSIVAEIVAVRSESTAEPLKDSKGPIHRPRPETATAPA